PRQFPSGSAGALHALERGSALLARIRFRSEKMSGQPSPDWNNTRLVGECLAGNEQAWHALLDRYKNLIYSIPVRYGAPQQDAADIFQLVCIDLFNQLARVRDAEALPGWLIRV